MQTDKFIRKVRPVEAVQVTDTNMDEIAQWCGGLVVPINGLNGGNTAPYVHVGVRTARKESDSQAYSGNWIIREDYRNYRVITNKQFKNSYDRLDKSKTAVQAVSPKSMPAKRNSNHHGTPVDPSGLTQATPTPMQVGAIAVVPGQPADANSHLTTGTAHQAVEMAATTGVISQETAATAQAEIADVEAHNTVARDINAATVDGDMVQLGQPIVESVDIADELCDTCGSPATHGRCTMEAGHIVSSAAEITQQA